MVISHLSQRKSGRKESSSRGLISKENPRNQGNPRSGTMTILIRKRVMVRVGRRTIHTKIMIISGEKARDTTLT